MKKKTIEFFREIYLSFYVFAWHILSRFAILSDIFDELSKPKKKFFQELFFRKIFIGDV